MHPFLLSETWFVLSKNSFACNLLDFVMFDYLELHLQVELDSSRILVPFCLKCSNVWSLIHYSVMIARIQGVWGVPCATSPTVHSTHESNYIQSSISSKYIHFSASSFTILSFSSSVLQ